LTIVSVYITLKSMLSCKYIQLLKKIFIIFKVSPFSRITRNGFVRLQYYNLEGLFQ
jgi:hypothetical protein